MRALVVVALLAVGCATPTRESFRPRSADVWMEGGGLNYLGAIAGGDAFDVRAGVSVHFDFEYVDEWEDEERP